MTKFALSILSVWLTFAIVIWLWTILSAPSSSVTASVSFTTQSYTAPQENLDTEYVPFDPTYGYGLQGTQRSKPLYEAWKSETLE